MADNELLIKDSNHALDAYRYLSPDNKVFIYNTVAASTRKVYRSDFNLFREWCEAANLAWMPPLPQTVSEYITNQSLSGIKAATIGRRLAAIKMACKAFECPNPTAHEIVKATMKGIRRVQGTAQDKKAPITADRLESLISHCPMTLRGWRDRALLLVGFGGAFRRSELVALTMNDIERTPEGIKITIRKSKTDQEGKGQTIAILNGTRFRVVEWLYKWIQEAGITEGHIFRRVRRGNSVQPHALTSHAVAIIIKQYASKSGLNIDSFSGHSLRSGFITSGAQAGADIFKLMEVSRHKKPETILGYVRESKLFDNHAGEKFL